MNENVVAQYFGTWAENGNKHCSWEQKFRPAEIPFDKLNRLYVALAELKRGADGHWTIAVPDDRVEHFSEVASAARKHNPSAELFVMVGNDDTSEKFDAAAQDPDFAGNVLAFLKEHGLVGCDLDQETYVRAELMSMMLQNLDQALHPAECKLTVAVWPYPNSMYDVPVVAKCVDQVNLMSYGHGFDLKGSISEWENAKMPASKLVGGIETEYDYGGGVDTIGDNGSIAQKCKIAKAKRLAGMMAWRLDNDYCTPNVCLPTYQGAEALWHYMEEVKA